MKIEWWRYIPGFVGLYMVSTFGRVKSFSQSKKKRKSAEHITYGSLCKSTGYMRINLCKDGKRNLKDIHRLVARAFPEICGKWFKGCQVNHKNEDKTDNRAENLEICTGEYNCNFGTRNKTISNKLNGNKNAANKHKGKSVLQLDKNGKFVQKYISALEAARTIGNENMESLISKCCRGEKQTAYGFIWKYE